MYVFCSFSFHPYRPILGFLSQSADLRSSFRKVPNLAITPVESCQQIGFISWQRLENEDFPFTDFEFIDALESSGSLGKESGWQTLHLVVKDEHGPAGVLLNYLKYHSYGEYIFDWEWARFYQRYGKEYYPKLLSALPFTPATGPRILLREGVDGSARDALIKAQRKLGDQLNLSSDHALFITDEEAKAFARNGYAIRHSMQYHWINRGFRDFQDYLEAFVGKRRRDISRERQRAASHGLRLEYLTGNDLKQAHAEAMYKLYHETTEKKGAIPYLKAEFFERVFATMPDRILLTAAFAGNEMTAAALNFKKGKKIFGRYWGSFSDYRDLHFELCYYMPIEYALREKLDVFEAGAQGEHKIQRGFLPATTLSAHYIRDEAFRKAIESYIEEEKAAIGEAHSEITQKGPFRENPPSPET